MLAKIAADQSVLVFPYDYRNLQQDNPFTRFGTGNIQEAFAYTEAWNRGERVVIIFETERPAHIPRNQKLELQKPVLRNGKWIAEWVVIEKTLDEIDADNADQSAAVRNNRNAKLAASDWTQVADAPVDKAAWATYRQALRDLTTQSAFPWDVLWPEQPV